MNLRARLTLVTTVVVGMVLSAFGTGVYLLQNKTLHDNVDETLVRRAQTVLSDLEVPLQLEFYIPPPGTIVEIVYRTGKIVDTTTVEGDEPIVPDARVMRVAQGRAAAYYQDLSVRGVDLRMLVAPFADRRGENFGAVMIAVSRENVTEGLRRLRLLLVWAGVVGLGLAAGLSWWAAKTALRPVEDVAAAATTIGTTGDLSRRVDPGGEDELGRLTKAFNGMLDRLEAAHRELERTLDGQRRFLADASHEMRTPLTTMRGNLEVIKATPGIAAPDLAAALNDSIGEAERMSRLIADLLAIARADARAQPPEQAVALGVVVREAIAGAQTADSASGGDGPSVAIHLDETVTVHGSFEPLRSVVTNLVENAMKYTPGDGRIDVTVAKEAPWAIVRVADTGIGMTADEVVHAFERFWRSDRSRGERGSGLGLAIVKAVVEEHGGAIVAESTPGRGTTMTVRLPLAPAGAAAEKTEAGAPARPTAKA